MADKLKNNRVSAVIGTDGREARPKHWIAVYTKPRREKKTAQDFIKKVLKFTFHYRFKYASGVIERKKWKFL